MKRIIVDNGDGSVGICIPAQKCINSMLRTVDGDGVFVYENADACISAIADKDIPDALSYRITGILNIPADRVFREAWTDDKDTETVDIDMPRAAEIAHAVRRVKRAYKFKSHDIDATIPSKAEAAEAARQIIRDEDADLQVDIDNSVDPEELKSLIEAY